MDDLNGLKLRGFRIMGAGGLGLAVKGGFFPKTPKDRCYGEIDAETMVNFFRDFLKSRGLEFTRDDFLRVNVQHGNRVMDVEAWYLCQDHNYYTLEISVARANYEVKGLYNDELLFQHEGVLNFKRPPKKAKS